MRLGSPHNHTRNSSSTPITVSIRIPATVPPAAACLSGTDGTVNATAKQIPTSQNATRVVRGNISKILPISVDYQTVTYSTSGTSDVVDNNPPADNVASRTDCDCRNNVAKVYEHTHSEYTAYNNKRERIAYATLPFIGVQRNGFDFQSTQSYHEKPKSQGATVKIDASNCR